ncbi:NAD-dependent epimerase/dehydratase family protein [Nocardia yunnanensis]|uniref:NAD-dependent epimerase/dehydratase family protein n=1 Tax=Nocardia yunnanensis TaxID=2382165 RepID=A0A386ZB08_9NOCA|nr:NAD(P)H-binding protein [Nocardia yunnanensis]AYF74447.1 NAD-dependent epimerase/dehydratase family protein [Nocardia yunnanensis]
MIVVTGATGNVGSALVRELAEIGEKAVAVSRGEKPVDLPGAAEHRRADIGDLDGLAAAVAGARALFLLITGPQLVSGPAPAQVLETIAAAGVRRVVFLSTQGAATRPGSAAYARTVAFEQALAASDLEWTVLRPAGFFSNTFAWIEPVKAQRMIPAPFGDVGLPQVDPADIAAVAAVALTRDGHAGRTYTVTGPEVVTPRQQAAALESALGEPIRFLELTREQARVNLLRFMPEPVADHTLDILGTPTPAEQLVSTDVEQVLGRPATDYAQWAARVSPAFR